TRLVYITQRCYMLHDLSFAAKCPHRHTAAYYLAIGNKVCVDAQPLLRATRRKPEPGHHLIKDEYDPFLITQGSQPLYKSRLWYDAPYFARSGLYDDRGYLSFIFSRYLPHCV